MRKFIIHNSLFDTCPTTGGFVIEEKIEYRMTNNEQGMSKYSTKLKLKLELRTTKLKLELRTEITAGGVDHRR